MLNLRDSQGSECHDSALTVVIGAHNDEDVFDRDDERERPKHHRGRAVNTVFDSRNVVNPIEDFLERIERTRTDIAEHDAEGAKGQEGLTLRARRAGCGHGDIGCAHRR